MGHIVWQARVPEEDWELLGDDDLNELCDKLDELWETMLEKKIRMKLIDKAIQKERG